MEEKKAPENNNRGPEWWARIAPRERKMIVQLSGILVLGLVLMYGAGLWGAGGGAAGGGNPLGSVTPGSPAPAAAPRAPEATITNAEGDLEQKLLRILSAVEGAGKVEVALSFGESAAAEYAVNTETSESLSEERDDQGGALTSSTSSESIKLAEINAAPVLIKEIMPRLNGAVIVAEGAGDPQVREQLHKAARVLLGLPAHRIEVIKSN